MYHLDSALTANLSNRVANKSYRANNSKCDFNCKDWIRHTLRCCKVKNLKLIQFSLFFKCQKFWYLKGVMCCLGPFDSYSGADNTKNKPRERARERERERERKREGEEGWSSGHWPVLDGASNKLVGSSTSTRPVSRWCFSKLLLAMSQVASSVRR